MRRKDILRVMKAGTFWRKGPIISPPPPPSSSSSSHHTTTSSDGDSISDPTFVEREEEISRGYSPEGTDPMDTTEAVPISRKGKEPVILKVKEMKLDAFRVIHLPIMAALGIED